MEAMRSAGPGGQNVNKRNSAIRITHLPSGISVKAMDERHQHDNMKVRARAERGRSLMCVQLAYRRLGAILLQQRVDKAYAHFSSSRKIQVHLQSARALTLSLRSVRRRAPRRSAPTTSRRAA